MATAPEDLSLSFFKRSIRVDAGNINLDADMIRLLVAIDEEKDMAQVAKETGMYPDKLRPALSKLLDLGLIEPVIKTVRYMDTGFYEAMRRTLAVAVGPMSDFILEDVLADMGISNERIPVHRASDLVGRIGQQIPDREARNQFEKTMLRVFPG